LRLDEILSSQKDLELSNLELQQAQQQVSARLNEIKLAAEVGRAISQVRVLDDMLDDAVERIRAQFNLYYTQVYLINPSQTFLEMEAGTGEVGQKLRQAGHQLALKANSINGRAALEKRPVVVSETTDSPSFKPNPLLPATRSEMAVPLMVGGQVIGVLDMQSEQSGALSEAILPAFEALAGQLAIAIQNARLLEEAEKSYAELQRYSARLSRENWAEYLDAIYKPETIGFVFEQGEIHALTEGQVEDDTELKESILIGGAPLGSLTVKIPENAPQAQATQLLALVSSRVAQHIENLRLLESAERYRLEAEQASRRLTREGWEEFISSSANLTPSYIYKMGEVRSHSQDELLQAESDGIGLPLKVRDESIGKLIVQGIEQTDNESLDIAREVANRLSAHLENLRLSIQTEQALATTKRQAQREQALGQITSAVRGSTDPATILRTAARELGTILGRKTVIRLMTDVAQETPVARAFAEDNPGDES
jgi:GAF domain-containing protein